MNGILLAVLLAIAALDVITWIFIIIIEHKDFDKALAWIVITIILPVIGAIGYFVIGQRIWLYRLYKGRKMSGDWRPEEVLPEELSFLNDSEGTDCTHGNRTEFFSDGRKMFDRMIDDISNAKESIRIEFYIILNDGLGGPILGLLSEKAMEGLDVILLGDAFGCRKLTKESLDILKESGVKVVLFNTPGLPYLNPTMNNRDHRKIVIVDSKISYCGGFNICSDYVGQGHVGNWRDSAVRMEGPVAWMMERRFLSTCRYCGLDIEQRSSVAEPAGDDTIVSVYGGPDIRPNPIMELHLNLIRNAKKSILLQTPYFMNKELIAAIRDASNNGVKVTLIIPGVIDHWFTFWNNYSCSLMLKGTDVDIRLYENGFLHSKTMIVDDRICIVGSSNFDDRTAYYNFETSEVIISEDCLKVMKTVFEEDLKDSIPMVYRDYRGFVPFLKRAICGVVRPLG